MLNKNNILETINMVENEHFDVRTITMGLSLFGCIRATAKETATAVYDLVCKRAQNLVATGKSLVFSTACLL